MVLQRIFAEWHLINTDYSASYETSWDWSALPDQHVYLTTHIYDNSGKSVFDPGGYVEVDLDRTSPVVSITSPMGGQTLTGNPITISADAIDSLSGVSQLEFFAGYNEHCGYQLAKSAPSASARRACNGKGNLAAADISAQDYWHEIGWDTSGSDGWSLDWDTSDVPSQTGVAVFVYAYDNAGNYEGAVQWDLSLGVSPDLAISDVQFRPSAPFTNDDVFMSVQVSNLSSLPAAGFWIDFYIDDLPTGCGDWGDYYGWQDGLDGNETVSWYIRIPANSLSSGDHEFRGYVDSGCAVAENDKTNNVSSLTAFTLTVPASPPPAFDDFDVARVMSPLPFNDSVDVSGLTTAWDDPEVPDCGGYRLAPGMASVWYQYTPSANTMLYLDTFGSGYDTYIAVWTGIRGSLTLAACNDDKDAHNYQSALQVKLTAGTTYYFRLPNSVKDFQ